MNERIEILAPAGSMESLKAAVYSGCNAVYMGGTAFSARANAANFDKEEMTEALKFCRQRDVKVYVTVNTLIKEDEMDEAIDYIRFLASIGVEGILVQDMGLFRVIKSIAPSLPIHTSTQLSVHTPEGVKFLEKMGAERVVLAREMSLNEMKEVRSGSKIELEAFVHGAHCMSVSGQCYFSAMLGSRSGNRGRCAQPCRLPFDNGRGCENSLSMKDMSLVKYLNDMEKAGICSAKIEGRLKRPEYVAAAVDVCREAIEKDYIDESKIDTLKSVFSRQGFTDGYITGKRGKEMYGIRTKEDVTSGNKEVFSKLHNLYKNEGGFVPVFMAFEMKCDEFAKLTLWDEKGNLAESISEIKAERALNRAMDEDKVKSLISKLGSTPYHLENCDIIIDGISTLPASTINAMRRGAVEKLNEIRGVLVPYECKEYVKDTALPEKMTVKEFTGEFISASQVPDNANELSFVYIPISEKLNDFISLKNKGINIAAAVPRCYFGAEKEIEIKIKILLENGIGTFQCGNIGAAALVKKLGGKVHGSYSLNIANSEALKFYEEMGLERAELSFELKLSEIEKIGGNLKRGIMVYGRQSLMLLRNCPIGLGSCVNCKNTAYITDRMGVKFPVICEKGEKYRSVQVYNSLPLVMNDKLSEINNCSYGVLRFTVENNVESFAVIEGIKKGEKPHENKTFGLYYRGVI